MFALGVRRHVVFFEVRQTPAVVKRRNVLLTRNLDFLFFSRAWFSEMRVRKFLCIAEWESADQRQQ